MAERYVYDPYGEATIYSDDWNSTVTWSSSRQNEILYCGYRWDSETGMYHVRNRSYHPTLGRWLQRDPGPDAGDSAHVRTSVPDIGGRFAACKTCPGGASSPTHVDRGLAVSMGRVVTGDIIGQYIDGMNLYEYVSSNPIVSRDPSGTIKCVDANAYLECMKYADENYKIRLAFAEAVWRECTKAVNRAHDTCIEDCKELPFGLNIACMALCTAGTALPYGGCLAAYSGALAGAHLSYIAEAEGCLKGATAEFPCGQCPEGYFDPKQKH